MAHKRTYAALQVLELLYAMEDWKFDGGQELTFDVDDSDNKLNLEVATDVDTSGKSNKEQCSFPRKKLLEVWKQRMGECSRKMLKDAERCWTMHCHVLQEHSKMLDLAVKYAPGSAEVYTWGTCAVFNAGKRPWQ